MMNNLNCISIVIIARNAQKTIAECLESVRRFDDVVVYLNGSTDDTRAEAEKFSNVVLVDGFFDGFGSTKNRAASFARNDWVFTLDSDEVMTEQLVNEIQSLSLDENAVYRVKRLNHYRRKAITCCGWGNDRVVRLYHRKRTEYCLKSVHESVNSNHLEVIDLDHFLYHYPFDSISGLVEKADRYSELYARNNYRKSSIPKAFGHAFFMFIKCYLIKKGVFNGFYGFIISFFNAFGTALKYLKLMENELTCSLIITTYNRPDALRLVISSALEQTRLPDEIIIADDGSTEETRAVVEEMSRQSSVPLVHSWQPDKGFRVALSRNRAVLKSSGEYLIMVDGDMLLHPEFIADHLKCADVGCFIQGSRVLLKKQATDRVLESQGNNLSLSSGEVKNRLNGFRMPLLSWLLCFIRSRSHKGIRTCNFSLFKKDFERVNGFNNEFGSWGREDSELVERLYNAGLSRKNLKFRAIQYHLYHQEGSASGENDALLAQSIEKKSKYCESGLKQVDQYD